MYENSVIKIIDFGTATKFQPGKNLTIKVGTADYIAPEGYQKNYKYLKIIFISVFN